MDINAFLDKDAQARELMRDNAQMHKDTLLFLAGYTIAADMPGCHAAVVIAYERNYGPFPIEVRADGGDDAS